MAYHWVSLTEDFDKTIPIKKWRFDVNNNITGNYDCAFAELPNIDIKDCWNDSQPENGYAFANRFNAGQNYFSNRYYGFTDEYWTALTHTTLVSGSTYEFEFPIEVYWAGTNEDFWNSEIENIIQLYVEETTPGELIPQDNIYKSGEEVVKLYRSGSIINKMYRSGELIFQALSATAPTPPPVPHTSAVTLYNATGGVIQTDVYSDGIIPNNAYKQRNDIAAVVIGPGIQLIGNGNNDSAYTFAQCYNLSSVTIPDTVTLIGGRAFEDTPSLKEVTIPASVETILTNAFYNFDETCTITFEGDIPYMPMDESADLGWATNIIVPDQYLTNYCTFLSSYY